MRELMDMRELMNIGLHRHMEDILRSDLVIIDGKVHKDRANLSRDSINTILTEDYPDITYDVMIDGGLIMYPFPDRKIIIMDTNLKFKQIK